MQPIIFSQAEAQDCITLLDTACKACGLQAALLAVPLFYKLKAAAEETPETETE